MEMLTKLPLAHRDENVFEILKQKFLEFLCEDKINDAILCLQDELGKVVEDNVTSSHKLREALHELTQTLLLNPEELRKKHCGNENSYKHSRENVLKTIMQRIDERAATPESRLDTLLVQALEYQMNRASFRYTENRCFSLLSNHTCNDVKIPTKSVRILDAHKDEVRGGVLREYNYSLMFFTWFYHVTQILKVLKSQTHKNRYGTLPSQTMVRRLQRHQRMVPS